eukprot:scaffold238727_cov33-Tisochrysis_lutea.AAC.3
MDENDQLRDLVQGLERRLANRAPKEREAKAKERAQREVRAFTSLCSPRLPCCIRMHCKGGANTSILPWTTQVEEERRALDSERAKVKKLELINKKTALALAEAQAQLRRLGGNQPKPEGEGEELGAPSGSGGVPSTRTAFLIGTTPRVPVGDGTCWAARLTARELCTHGRRPRIENNGQWSRLSTDINDTALMMRGVAGSRVWCRLFRASLLPLVLTRAPSRGATSSRQSNLKENDKA